MHGQGTQLGAERASASELWIDLANTRIELPPRPLYGRESAPVLAVRAIDAGGTRSRLVIQVAGKTDYAVGKLPHELLIRLAPAGQAPNLAAPVLVRASAGASARPERRALAPAPRFAAVAPPPQRERRDAARLARIAAAAAHRDCGGPQAAAAPRWRRCIRRPGCGRGGCGVGASARGRHRPWPWRLRLRHRGRRAAVGKGHRAANRAPAPRASSSIAESAQYSLARVTISSRSPTARRLPIRPAPTCSSRFISTRVPTPRRPGSRPTI